MLSLMVYMDVSVYYMSGHQLIHNTGSGLLVFENIAGNALSRYLGLDCSTAFAVGWESSGRTRTPYNPARIVHALLEGRVPPVAYFRAYRHPIGEAFWIYL